MRIIFEFVGGPMDGRVFRGTLGEPSDAERYFLVSNRGAPGHRFKVASPYAVETLASEQLKDATRHQFQRHFYTVAERIENDEEVWVSAEYLPEAVE
jgi:hypothetical protein